MYGAPVPVLLSVLMMLKLKVPPAVGVPESVPVEVSVMPGGSEPTEMT